MKTKAINNNIVVAPKYKITMATSFIQQAASFTITRRPLFYSRHHLPSQKSRLAAYNSAVLTDNSIVSVFDNVLSPACCAQLTSDELYSIGPDVYRRNQGTVSPTDVLIESILTNLGTPFQKTKEVEWWGRSTYKSVEAHRDVDEEAASTRGEHRYPTHSVIVYLDVEEHVPGPTCIWVPLTLDGNDNENERRQSSALLAVPVVPGRLLVFSGELLHAVPSPALQWLGPHHGDEGTMRRVIVLNLWNDHAPKEEEWLDDDEEDDWDDEEEDDDEGPIEFFAKKVECEPRSLWKTLPLLQVMEDDEETTTAAAPSITLSTRSHGSDELLKSPIHISHSSISDILESKSIPQWIKTSADVTDLGIGVPSVAGSREERMW